MFVWLCSTFMGRMIWANDCVCWDASVHRMPQKAHLNTNYKTLAFYFRPWKGSQCRKLILPIHAHGKGTCCAQWILAARHVHLPCISMCAHVWSCLPQAGVPAYPHASSGGGPACRKQVCPHIPMHFQVEHVCECQFRLGFCRDCRDALATL